MIIRRANIFDAETLATYRREQLLEEGLQEENNIDEELLNYFSANLASGGLVMFVGIEDDKIVCTAGMNTYDKAPTFSNPNGKVAMLGYVYTLKEYRQKGYATQLLNQVLSYAKEDGFLVAYIHGSKKGKPLYIKNGFKELSDMLFIKL